MNLPRMIRNLWIYRRVLLLAVVLGLVASFVWSNNEPVKISFPLVRLEISSTSGLVMLVSAALGAGATWLVLTFRLAVQSAREQKLRSAEQPGKPQQESQPSPQVSAPKEVPEEPQTAGSGKEAVG